MGGQRKTPGGWGDDGTGKLKLLRTAERTGLFAYSPRLTMAQSPHLLKSGTTWHSEMLAQTIFFFFFGLGLTEIKKLSLTEPKMFCEFSVGNGWVGCQGADEGGHEVLEYEGSWCRAKRA